FPAVQNAVVYFDIVNLAGTFDFGSNTLLITKSVTLTADPPTGGQPGRSPYAFNGKQLDFDFLDGTDPRTWNTQLISAGTMFDIQTTTATDLVKFEDLDLTGNSGFPIFQDATPGSLHLLNCKLYSTNGSGVGRVGVLGGSLTLEGCNSDTYLNTCYVTNSVDQTITLKGNIIRIRSDVNWRGAVAHYGSGESHFQSIVIEDNYITADFYPAFVCWGRDTTITGNTVDTRQPGYQNPYWFDSSVYFGVVGYNYARNVRVILNDFSAFPGPGIHLAFGEWGPCYGNLWVGNKINPEGDLLIYDDFGNGNYDNTYIEFAGNMVNRGQNNCFVGDWNVTGTGTEAFPETCIDTGVLSHIDPTASIGQGTSIGTGCLIKDNSRIGDSVNIGNNTLIGSDVKIKEDTWVSGCSVLDEGATVKRSVSMGSFSYLGKESTIREECTIGLGVHIGHNTEIKENISVGDGAVIGNDVDVEEDCVIGSNCTILDGANVPAGTNIPDGSTFPAIIPAHEIQEPQAALANPTEFALLQNYPNTFNPDTWIPYQLAEDVDVAIKIYDVAGRFIRVLDLGFRPAGFYTTKDKAAYWDGRNEAGEQVSSGIYYYSITAGDFSATRKMIVKK
ncbi:FlgD immunoglobulin-like domain containing protein, partial [Candidatus Poribacteria bacterium]